MKIFFDTEFSGLRKDTELISIGLISEDGREFYAEISDIDTKNVDKWVYDNVLMNTVEFGNAYVLDICENENNYYVGTKLDVSNYLREWLMQFDDVELVSDVCHYDMVLFIDLFGTAFDLPTNVGASCHDINQDIARIYNMTEKEAFDYSREKLLEGHNINIGGEKHNSMYDARVIQKLYELLLEEEKV